MTTDIINTTNTIKESTIRSRAKRAGYVMRKSRRAYSIDNFGEFMLINAQTNFAALGSRFDASLEQIDDFLSGGDIA